MCRVDQSHVVIAGVRPGVVITDTTCQGKALFVVTGQDTMIRDLTLARARVPDRNGAGIREEGQGLILRRVHFVDDQVGLLDGSAGAARSAFPTAASKVAASAANAHLRGAGQCREPVADRRFQLQGRERRPDQHLGGRTELSANQIEAGTGEEPAVAVSSGSGHLVMEDNILSMGPRLTPVERRRAGHRTGRSGVAAQSVAERHRSARNLASGLDQRLPHPGGQSGRAGRRGAIHHRIVAAPRVRPVPPSEERSTRRCGADEARPVGTAGPMTGRLAVAVAVLTISLGATPVLSAPVAPFAEFEVIMWQDHSPSGNGRAVAARLHRGQADGHTVAGSTVQIGCGRGHRACPGMWRTSRPTSFHRITATRQESP